MRYFYFLFSVFLLTSVKAQQQVGDTKCSTSQSIYHGQSVKMSANGQRMIVGGDGYTSLLSTRVYELNNGAWTDLGAIFQNTNVQNNFVMVPVSCNAACNRIVYSDVYNDEAGSNRGKVVVRELQGSNWVILGNGIFGEQNGELSGSALDMSADGNRIIVGSNRNDTGGTDRGKAKVYELQNGIWTQLGGDLTGTANGDYFGTAVIISVDGNRVACGAPFNDNIANSSGTVTIYEFSAGQWLVIGQLNGTGVQERFGGALSFNESATILAVGCDKLYGPGGGANLSVEVYQQQGGAWNQLGNSIPAQASDEYFGAALALSQSGNAIAIGAPQHDIQIGDNSGYTKVYQLNSNTWNQVGSTIFGIPGGAADNCGFSLSFSNTGRLAVGSPFAANEASVTVGCMSVYDFSGVLANSEWQSETIDAWPNPVELMLQIDHAPVDSKFVVKDVMGKELLKSDSNVLDMRNLCSGIYLVEISSGNQKTVRKILKR